MRRTLLPRSCYNRLNNATVFNAHVAMMDGGRIDGCASSNVNDDQRLRARRHRHLSSSSSPAAAKPPSSSSPMTTLTTALPGLTLSFLTMKVGFALAAVMGEQMLALQGIHSAQSPISGIP